MSAGQFCMGCGTAIPSGAQFCPKCGKQAGSTPARVVAPPPKIKAKRRVHPLAWLLLLGGIVWLVSQAGGGHGTSASGAAAQPTVWPIKQAVATKDWTLQVADVSRPGKVLKWSDYGNTVTAAGTFVVVKIDMKNTGTTNFGVNTWDFELKDSAGIIYKHADQTGTSGYSEYAGGKRLGEQVPPGVTVAYFLVYDINPAANGLQLVFKQSGNPVFGLGQ